MKQMSEIAAYNKNPANIREGLERVSAILSSKDRWVKGTHGLDRHGSHVDWTSPDMCKCSLPAAVYRAYPEENHDVNPCLAYLKKQLKTINKIKKFMPQNHFDIVTPSVALRIFNDSCKDFREIRKFLLECLEDSEDGI